MQKSKILKTIVKNIFAALCFVFTSFLLFVVIYETAVTGELPTDDKKPLQIIGEKYSFMPKIFGDSGLDENEEFDDESEKHEKGWYED